MCLFATRYLGDREEAADVVQETFLKYWNKHTDFDDYRKIKSFLYVVVRHACLNSEIAEKMNLSEGTVHAYKKEAYKKLRISLKDYYYLLPFLLFISR